MKTLKLIALSSVVWFLAACGSVEDLPLDPQAPGECLLCPVPSWVSLGNPVYAGANPNNYGIRSHLDVEVVVNNQTPIMAYLEWQSVTPGLETFMRSDLVVSQWNNTTKTWNKLGSAVDATNDDVDNFSLAAKGQTIVVAYDLCVNMPDNNCDVGSHTTYVKQWTGTTWQQLGGVFCPGSAECRPQIALGSDGNPVLLLNNPLSNNPTPQGVLVYRWNGSSWQQLGGKLDSYAYSVVPQGNGRDLQIVVDNQGNPIVAFAEREDYDEISYLRVKRWNGSSWQTLGSSAVVTTSQMGGFNGYSLTLSAGTTPVVAYSLYENGSSQLSVRYYGTCTNPFNYPCWKLLGDQTSLGAGRYPVLVSREESQPYAKTVYALAYINNDNLYVKQLGFTNWSLVGSNPLDVTLSKKIEAHDLAFDGSKPLAVWLEPNDPMNHKKLSTVHAKRYQ